MVFFHGLLCLLLLTNPRVVVGSTPEVPRPFRSRYALQPATAYRGVAYSAFLHEGPEPEGHHEPLSAESIERDMKILKEYNVQWIRTYATDLNGSLVPSIAKDCGINTFIGTWVNAGDEGVVFWREELKRAEEALKKDDRLVPIIILGNELAYTKRQSIGTLLMMVQEAKAKGFYVALGDIPPSFLDSNYAGLWAAADILLVHSHPYFSHIRTLMNVRVMGTRLMPDAAGADDVIKATLKIQETFPNQLVMIGESGYPSQDDSSIISPAKCRWCTEENQKHFLESLLYLADVNKLGIFAFEAFDEHWKGEVGEEAGSGPHWGFFDAERTPKAAGQVLRRWAGTVLAGADFPPPMGACDYLISQAECLPKDTVDQEGLQAILEFACNEGVVDCEELTVNPLLSGCPVKAKASWAATKYFQQNMWRDSACDFNGTMSPHFSGDVLGDAWNYRTIREPDVDINAFIADEEYVPTSDRYRRACLALLAAAAIVGAAVLEMRTRRLRELFGRARHGQYLEV